MSDDFKRIVSSLSAGVVFALGLAVSGLANPDKVLNFLTPSVDWSPSLLFTMGAGIVVTFFGYRLVIARGSAFGSALDLPTKTQLDARLLCGAAIFGVGWGLAGFCPGPAITGLSSGMPEPYLFVAAMIAGSLLQRLTMKA